MILYEFPLSHFCEKARFALDYKNVTYQRVPKLPAVHFFMVRLVMGMKHSSLPILVDGENAVQGSSEIITYLEQKFPGNPLTPTGGESSLVAFEKEIDESIGAPMRQLGYFHSLRAPLKASKIWSTNTNPLFKAQVLALYPISVLCICVLYGMTRSSANTSIKTMGNMLDKLDARLANQKFLAGDHFSRIDLTAASLLSFIALPPTHPQAWPNIQDFAELMTLKKQWDDRPIFQHVRRVYAEFRDARNGQAPTSENMAA